MLHVVVIAALEDDFPWLLTQLSHAAYSLTSLVNLSALTFLGAPRFRM